MGSLKNKVAIVTGGGSGIGKSISEVFAASEARVRILDSNLTQAQSVAKEIQDRGYLATAYECDVSSRASVLDVIDRHCLQEGIDILVNNAGISHVGDLEHTSEADIDRLIGVNVKGAYNCMSSCIPSMKARRRGVILNIGSIAAMVGLAERFGYSASKGAVLAMTYSVAKDYLAYNIRCNCISPARIHTPFVDGFVKANYPGKEKEVLDKLSRSQPIGRMGQPDEVALLARFLCSDEASFITGANYPIDGGALTLSI